MELKIDSYIHELLYEHNCVIIPAFGGFVGNYKGAEIHPTQHIFTAPCKQIAFNKSLTVNDGLLANYIAQKESIAYPEALEFIEKEVFKIKHLLATGEKVTINSTGFLKLDVEKNIQFFPSNSVNYNTESFGLFNFQSATIKREATRLKVEKTFIDRPTKKEKSKTKVYQKYLVPLLMIPIALALYLAPFGSDLKNRIAIQTSGYFNSSEEVKLYTPNAHQFQLQEALIVPLQMAEAVTSEHSNAAINNLENVSKNAVEQLNAPITTHNTFNELGNFIVISGCFSILENAERQIQILETKNIQAQLMERSPSGLYRVSCGRFNSFNDAQQTIQNIKAQGSDAWVMKN